MKFFEGDLQSAISKRKTFSSAFIVFVEARDEESARIRRYLDEENSIPAKEYVAFRLSPASDVYKHFSDIYRDVPVPSVFIIGSDGEPIRVLSSCETRDELYAGIRAALEVHKRHSLEQRRTRATALAQILLKLPRDETAVVEFADTASLREVKVFVRESFRVQEPFDMITPYPRRVFTGEDEGRTLGELELAPTSTILVVPAGACKPWTPPLVARAFRALASALGRLVRRLRDLASYLRRRPR